MPDLKNNGIFLTDSEFSSKLADKLEWPIKSKDKTFLKNEIIFGSKLNADEKIFLLKTNSQTIACLDPKFS